MADNSKSIEKNASEEPVKSATTTVEPFAAPAVETTPTATKPAEDTITVTAGVTAEATAATASVDMPAVDIATGAAALPAEATVAAAGTSAEVDTLAGNVTQEPQVSKLIDLAKFHFLRRNQNVDISKHSNRWLHKRMRESANSCSLINSKAVSKYRIGDAKRRRFTTDQPLESMASTSKVATPKCKPHIIQASAKKTESKQHKSKDKCKKKQTAATQLRVEFKDSQNVVVSTLDSNMSAANSDWTPTVVTETAINDVDDVTNAAEDIDMVFTRLRENLRKFIARRNTEEPSSSTSANATTTTAVEQEKNKKKEKSADKMSELPK